MTNIPPTRILKVLDPYYQKPAFDPEQRVATLIEQHKNNQFTVLRHEVHEARRMGIARLQSLVHTNHRNYLQSSRAMAAILRDVTTLKKGINSTKQAIASLCAVSFATDTSVQESRMSSLGDAEALGPAVRGAGSAGAGASAAAAVDGANGGVDTRWRKSFSNDATSTLAGAQRGSLAQRLSRTCTVGAVSALGLRSSTKTKTAAKPGAGKDSQTTYDPRVRTSTSEWRWRSISDAVSIALASRNYEAAVDRVLSASTTFAAIPDLESSVLLLENRVVRAMSAELHALPPTAFQLHRPLLVCLLDLGRVTEAADAFLRGQQAWIEEEQQAILADGEDDLSMCGSLTDITVAMVAHAVEAHRQLFRGAELSRLGLWAQARMRALASTLLAPIIRAAFSTTAGGGTLKSAGNGGGSGATAAATEDAAMLHLLPVFEAMHLSEACAGQSGMLADCGIGSCASAVADSLIPVLISLAEVHTDSILHEMCFGGSGCLPSFVFEMIRTVANEIGFRRDSVEAESTPFSESPEAIKLWNDVLRCTPMVLHGRQYIAGVGRYLKVVLPALFTLDGAGSPTGMLMSGSGTLGGSTSNPTMQPTAATAEKEKATERKSAYSRRLAAGKGDAAPPTTTTTTTVTRTGTTGMAGAMATQASTAAGAPSSAAAPQVSGMMPLPARRLVHLVHSLWLAEGTLRLLHHALSLLPAPRSTTGAALEAMSSLGGSGSYYSPTTETEKVAAEAVQHSPLLIDVIDAALGDLCRKHLADILRSREEVYSAYAASLLRNVSTASPRRRAQMPTGEDDSHAPAAVSLADMDEETLEHSEDLEFTPCTFIAPADVRMAGNAVAAATAITVIAWAIPYHFRGSESHHTAGMAARGHAFVRTRLLQRLISVPSVLSITKGTPFEIARYDLDADKPAERLKRLALTSYSSANTFRVPGKYSVAVSTRLFGFYFEEVSSTGPRDLPALLPFAILIGLKLRQLFGHIARYAGRATAAALTREAIIELCTKLLFTKDFWIEMMPQVATAQSTPKEQISMFLGCMLHSLDPILRTLVMCDPRDPFQPSATGAAIAELQTSAKQFVEGTLGSKTLSLDVAIRQAASTLATQAFELHEGEEPPVEGDSPLEKTARYVDAAVAANTNECEAWNTEKTVSLATLRADFQRLLGPLGADTVGI
jgi:hypothetical protein